MLPRILEPEVMDSPADAHEYDSMDHAAVNRIFVTDLLTALADWSLQRPVKLPIDNAIPLLKVLDLGAGTAQIPIELARRAPNLHITAVDAAGSMLALARQNIAAAEIPLPRREGRGEGSFFAPRTDRIDLALADAKRVPFADATFDVTISNSIVHHIAEPHAVLAEAIRVTTPGGLLFHRDLARPNNEATLDHLVATYAADTTPYQRRLFAESLHAALTAEEMADLVATFGFARDTIRMTSDRHWTWIAMKP